MPTAVPQVLAAPLPTAQAVAELAPTLAPQTPASYHAVPALRQRPGSYECGPTSVSMVLAYYHALNSDLPALTPGEIIRDLGARFNPKRGIAPDKLVAALQEMNLGYRTVEWSSGLDQQALLDELHQGPVIALVRSRLSRNGYPHLLVVTGMAADGSSVQLNDPLTGGGRLVSWETFEGAWSFEEYPAAFHVIVRLRP